MVWDWYSYLSSSDHVTNVQPLDFVSERVFLWGVKILLSFSLHIIKVLLSLFVYKCPSDLEAISGKSLYKYIHI